MCFSSSASLIAGSALIATGVLSSRFVTSRAQVPLATIPFVFGAQQLVESVVWMGLTDESWSQFIRPATYVFLLIAQGIWPALVPLAIFSAERNAERRKLLIWLMVPGITIAATMVYRLIAYELFVSVGDHHVNYDLPASVAANTIMTILYIVSTVMPALLSTDKKIIVLGVMNLAALIATTIFFRVYLVSVWCFFAAVISVMILWILKKQSAAPALSQNGSTA